MKNVKRLFIAEYEATNIWTGGKRSILNDIREGDFYLIFKTGRSDKPLSNVCASVIKDMAERKILIDVTRKTSDECMDEILKNIKEYANANTYIFFLKMENVYQELKPRIKETENVYQNATYKVARFIQKNNKGNNKKKKKEPAVSVSNKNQIFGGMVTTLQEEKKEKGNNLTDISENQAFDDLVTMKNEKHKNDVQKTSPQQQSTQVQSGEKDNPQKNPQYGAVRGSAQSNYKSHNLGSKKEPTPQERYTNLGKSPQQQEIPDIDMSQSGLTVGDLEKQIFDTKILTGEFVRDYSELDQKKADLIKTLFDRTVNSLISLTHKMSRENHEDADYVQLFTVLLKSTGYEDFCESWTVTAPNDDFLIDKNTYLYILDEVRYYAKVCSLLFSEDEWN